MRWQEGERVQEGHSNAGEKAGSERIHMMKERMELTMERGFN